MATNLKEILKGLERKGFTLKHSSGSLAKLYPPEKEKLFYSLHLGSDRAIHPLRRFAKKNWNLDLFNLD